MNTDESADVYRRNRERFGVIWPSVLDGVRGPLTTAMGVSSFPTVLVLDHERTVRAIGVLGEDLDRVVDELVAAARAARDEG